MLALLERALRGVLVGIVAVMVAVVFAQVLARYGFNRSFGWAEEIGRLAFVWTVFLGMAVAVRARGHIAIGLLLAALPGALRRPAQAAIALACAALSGLVAWQGMVILLDQWDERMVSLDLSAGWFLVPVVLGGGLCALFFLAAVRAER